MWEKSLIFIIVACSSLASFWLGRYPITMMEPERIGQVMVQMERFITVLQENQRKITELQEEIERLAVDAG